MNKEIMVGYLNTARSKIEAAKILLDHCKYDDAVSRAYYAVFHCAQALLLSIGVKAESHSGVRQLFGLYFIYTFALFVIPAQAGIQKP
ncbi:MAG: HEPN domain-containing protein [bacterium]